MGVCTFDTALIHKLSMYQFYYSIEIKVELNYHNGVSMSTTT